MARAWPSWFTKSPKGLADSEKDFEEIRRKVSVPSIWLFGKTGSGKSSIVRYLTGAESATIGEGYRPETKTSQRFDFPDSNDPLLSFLDTRGLGEASYDPRLDIERFQATTQLMIVAVRASDQALKGILEPLRQIRRSSPKRPIILVITCLHESVVGMDLTVGPDPFLATASSSSETPHPGLPENLRTLLEEKKCQFDGLFDVMIPIDLTQKEDGFADPNFGGKRLKQSILEYLPHAYRQALLVLNETKQGESDRQKRVRWQVLASSALAGTAGAVPFPWVDIPVVLGIQAHLAVRIAAIHEQPITSADWAVLSSAASSRIALQFAVRESLKLVPFVGIAVGAAGAFAITYALGMSWDWYYANKRSGNVPSPAKLQQIFAEQLQRGRELWRDQ